MTHRCAYCDKEFLKERSLEVHVCEPKRRYQEQKDTGVQLGLQAFLRFYEITQGSARLKTFDDFARSAYYRAFVRFGRHVQAIRAVNPQRFVEWLLKHNKKIDHWCQDRIYDEYLVEYVRQEAVADALARAVETALEWQEQTNNPSAHYLRFGNDNVICHDITRGRVTAWTIYNCASGQEFLARINPEQISIIWAWIDADIWQRRFRDYPADQALAQEILSKAGW
jgi:hypothetical protein